jgi:hypothetical protein
VLQDHYVLVGGAIIALTAMMLSCNLLGRDDEQLTFWSYMVAYVLIFSVMLAVARQQVFGRYLIELWLIPVATMALWWRLAKNRTVTRILFYGALGIWIAANVWQSWSFGEMVYGWEGASMRAKELALTNPGALQPKDFIGIGVDDEEVARTGLEIMKRLHVNIFSTAVE